MTLFQFFKQPPNEEAAQMARAGDIFECALDMVKDKLIVQHPRRLNIFKHCRFSAFAIPFSFMHC